MSNVRLIKIASIGTSADGNRTFARDIAGAVYFPQNKDMELVAGTYACVIDTMQTKTRDENGELIDLPTPRPISQITATFKTMVEAAQAVNESKLLELTANVELHKAKQSLLKELNLDDAAMKELAAAW